MQDKTSNTPDEGTIICTPDSMVNLARENLGQDLPFLLSYLRELGLDPRPGCGLLEAAKKLERARHPDHDEREHATPIDMVKSHLAGLSVEALASAFKRAHAKGFSPLRETMKNLIKGDPAFMVAGNDSPARNKAWELTIGCIMQTFCNRVSFEEPDLKCSYKGKTISVAAKCIYSVDQVDKRVREGVRQLAKHPGDGNLVFINVASIYPEEKTFPILPSISGREADIATALRKDVLQWAWDIGLNDTVAQLNRRGAAPALVYLFVPTCVFVQDRGLLFSPLVMPVIAHGADPLAPEYLKKLAVAPNDFFTNLRALGD